MPRNFPGGPLSMPRKRAVPSYRSKVDGANVRAVVTLTDAQTGRRRDYQLGEHNTPESHELYLETVAAWEKRGRRLPETARPVDHRVQAAQALLPRPGSGERDSDREPP